MRADAMRNREALVTAAATVLADAGLDASVAEIAASAGVAKGTVFRHFATKEDLVAVVVARHVEGLAERAEELLSEQDPMEALSAFVAAGTELQARDRAFCQVAATAELTVPGLVERRERLEEIADLLARRARDAGQARSGLTGRDVIGLMTAAYQGACAAGDPERWPYFQKILLAGLRTIDEASPDA
ncbi:TetR/AcrR family transcriptional regulator [Isoptericola sp. NPDC056578]|uniref:TetR/AcrR family transcriptional regulator n=1 Tax=Isoptericola sp. NPDC056578 TaxID=3345870 RepID=UPI0036A4313E